MAAHAGEGSFLLLRQGRESQGGEEYLPDLITKPDVGQRPGSQARRDSSGRASGWIRDGRALGVSAPALSLRAKCFSLLGAPRSRQEPPSLSAQKVCVVILRPELARGRPSLIRGAGRRGRRRRKESSSSSSSSGLRSGVGVVVGAAALAVESPPLVLPWAKKEKLKRAPLFSLG